MQRCETITFVYNESFLLPYFFKHYSPFVDRFNIIYDRDSTDKTLDILRSNPKVNIIFIKFPDMMDDVIKVNFINQIYAGLKDCWVLNVDTDEFAFLENRIPQSSINRINLYQVYRHKTEKDLDINLSVKEQRRHGVIDNSLESYCKPIFIRSGLDIEWQPGNHRIKDLPGPFPVLCDGAHWVNADPCFCVERRVKNRRDRQSKYNLEYKLTIQHHGITEQDVIDECKRHENDPQVW